MPQVFLTQYAEQCALRFANKMDTHCEYDIFVV